MKAKCSHCKSENTIRKGFRKTKNRGKIQKYFCNDCKKYFTSDDGFYRMRNNEKIITMSIDMYLSNLSSRKMRNQLKRHFQHKISHVSILDWVRRYILRVQKYVDKLQPELSGKFYADETEIPRSQRKDKKNDIFWCSIDWDSRYINGTYYSPYDQSIKEAIKFLNNVKKKTQTAKVYPD